MTRILKYIPVIGQKYNEWTVISDQIFKKEGNRATYWKVKCKCGKEMLREAQHIMKGKSKMCMSCTKLKNPFEESYLNKVIRRCNKAGFEFDLDIDYIIDLFNKQEGKCALSGEPIKFGRFWDKLTDQTCSLDRIDSSKGYIKGNVQWVHKDVNFMKGSLSEERFIELCKLIGSSKCG